MPILDKKENYENNSKADQRRRKRNKGTDGTNRKALAIILLFIQND